MQVVSCDPFARPVAWCLLRIPKADNTGHRVPLVRHNCCRNTRAMQAAATPEHNRVQPHLLWLELPCCHCCCYLLHRPHQVLPPAVAHGDGELQPCVVARERLRPAVARHVAQFLCICKRLGMHGWILSAPKGGCYVQLQVKLDCTLQCLLVLCHTLYEDKQQLRDGACACQMVCKYSSAQPAQQCIQHWTCGTEPLPSRPRLCSDESSASLPGYDSLE